LILPTVISALKGLADLKKRERENKRKRTKVPKEKERETTKSLFLE